MAEPQPADAVAPPPAKRAKVSAGDRVAVLDAGAQYGKVIDRRVRELSVDCAIFPLSTPASELKGFKAVIISGGPQSVYGPQAPKFDPDLFALGVPILGICYGFQLMNFVHGGTVEKKAIREDGQFEIETQVSSPLFAGLAASETVLLTHGDSVDKVAEGFEVIARSGEIVAGIQNREKGLYAVQFHPEVDLTPNGKTMLHNFLFGIAKCEGSFTIACRETAAIALIKEKVKDKKVLVLVSGGVDSAVCCALVTKAIGSDRVIAVHVDHGFMRKNESAMVKKALGDVGVNLSVINAQEEFASASTEIDGRRTCALRDCVEPEDKRRIIGDTFMSVTNKFIADLGLHPDDVFLAQGTLRPDLIESASELVSSNATVIKTHHNDTAVVRQLRAQGRIVEPLCDYHKDEVRELGTKLGLPRAHVWRQPFPGPGLAIRIICQHTPFLTPSFDEDNARLAAMSLGDGVHATLLPVRTVGVQGDGRSYHHIAALSSEKEPDWPVLMDVVRRIPREFHSVNRVVFVFGEVVRGPIRDITPTYPRPDAISQLQEADSIVNDLLVKHDLTHTLSQVPVVLFPVGFGVPGGRAIGIRTFITNDFMTGRPAQPGKDIPLEAVNDIVRSVQAVKGISRVALDLTPKPPATTEWE